MNQKGFTVLELLAAIVVTTTVLFILFGVFKFTNGLFQKNLNFAVTHETALGLTHSLEENLFNAKGIVSGSPSEIVFQKVNGKTGVYLWDGLKFKYNQHSLGTKGFTVREVRFDYFGASSDGEEADFFGLDRDHDGKIALEETARLRRIQATLRWAGKSDSGEYTVQVKVRGRAN